VFPVFIKSFKTTSKSASCACELPECYPLQAICASRVVSNPLLCYAGITTYENISTVIPRLTSDPANEFFG